MELIQSVISLVKDHWVEILALIGALDIVLGIITKWTPVTWDDSVYAVVHNWVAKLGAKK